MSYVCFWVIHRRLKFNCHFVTIQQSQSTQDLKMLNRSYYTFICVAATLLLICSNFDFAQGKAVENKVPPVSTATPAVQTSTAGRLVAVTATAGQIESQVATAATPTGSNGTSTITKGTPGSNGTETVTQGTPGSNGTSTVTKGTPGSNGTETVTQGTPGSNGTETVTQGTPGSNGTETVTQGTPGSKETPAETGTVPYPTQSDDTNQTPSVLSIYLVNDLQYDIFPVHQENGSMCDTHTEAGKCVGGLPSLKDLIDKEVNLSQSVLLNAGNTLGGDLFKTLKFDAAVHAMKLLNFSAMAVGPNVFKYGGGAGQMYLDGLNESIVVSNIDPAPQHNIDPAPQKSVVIRFGNCSVAVIGYLENTEQDKDIEGVIVKNYTESVLEEIERIHRDQKNASNLITVVIGSSSVSESKLLAASNETIDFVLFSGGNWSEGNTNGSQFYYESVSQKSSNKTAYVASLRVNHSSVADRFLVGVIELPLNNCRVVNPTFNVINYTNPTNNSAWDLIKSELEALESQDTSLTMNTKDLTAEENLCCHSECSVGNLITDAMVAALSADCTLCVNVTSIGIFPAVHLKPNVTIPKGSVSVTSLYDLDDQDVYIYSVRLTGRQLRDILEVSIKSISNSNSTDFLHVSRLLQIEYRKDRDNKSEIVSVRTVTAASSSMQLNEIDVNDTATFYNVSFPRSLFKMDSYKKLVHPANATFHYVTIVEAVAKYINNTIDLSLPVLGSRIVYLEEPTAEPTTPPVPCASHTGTTVAVTLVVAALIVGIIIGIWRWRSIRSHLLPGYVNF